MASIFVLYLLLIQEHNTITIKNFIVSFYSIMALVNADYEFIFVDVGKNGRLSDGGVIESTKFYHKLIHGQLHLPNNTDTENNFNFVFLGDEAFSLHENFLKPYPQRDLSYNGKVDWQDEMLAKGKA
ncbi:unnamed protein product [Acanthoscelides obtectus]|uniref:DDE Tnp4 domain-containing protein n=1 Tax=Acanthoscelides obtectus TaxID=200917 RepID=A0A9P0KVW3_ACAOB|nr:unnamed protein product [Acanthoscelides obtectus]CAK1631273.1 hypothetical protein AOBTE_LOCUS6846 [Acanthoscelides obtectus]